MKNYILVAGLFCAWQTGNLFAQSTKTVTGFNHIESVATDGKYLYVADIGKELNPTAKDGDGKIFRFDLNGTILDSNIVNEKIDAPKGLAIRKGVLYVADIDRLIAFEIKTGNKLFQIDFSKDASFLNDIALAEKNTLFISATDKSLIFKVDLISKTYAVLKTDTSIAGTNGIFYDAKSKRLYVNGMGSDNKPNGIIGFINLVTNSFTRISTLEGYFDGICLVKGELYFSNWVAFEKKGIVGSVNLKSGKLTVINSADPIGGPADFIILKNQLIVPSMLSGELNFIPLH